MILRIKSILTILALAMVCLISVGLMSDVSPASSDDKLPELLEAALDGKTDLVRQLIASGADVNEKYKDSGATALMCAAGEGHIDIVQILIANGADVNAKKINGVPVLYFAVLGNNQTILETLIKHGAGEKIVGKIFKINIHLVIEQKGYGSVLEFELQEHPGKKFVINRDLAERYGLIEPLSARDLVERYTEPMKLRREIYQEIEDTWDYDKHVGVGPKVEIIYYNIKQWTYSTVVYFKVLEKGTD